MKSKGVITLIDEPYYVADIDGYIASWVQQHYGSLEASLPPEHAKDKRSIIKWIGQVLTDPDRHRDSASVDCRVGLIRYLEKLMRMEFSSTTDLRQHVERYLDGHDGRRLPVPQAIRRARKKLKLTQRQLAEQLGFKDHTLISKYEKGQRLPSDKVIEWLKGGEM